MSEASRINDCPRPRRTSLVHDLSSADIKLTRLSAFSRLLIAGDDSTHSLRLNLFCWSKRAKHTSASALKNSIRISPARWPLLSTRQSCHHLTTTTRWRRRSLMEKVLTGGPILSATMARKASHQSRPLRTPRPSLLGHRDLQVDLNRTVAPRRGCRFWGAGCCSSTLG